MTVAPAGDFVRGDGFAGLEAGLNGSPVDFSISGVPASPFFAEPFDPPPLNPAPFVPREGC